MTIVYEYIEAFVTYTADMIIWAFIPHCIFSNWTLVESGSLTKASLFRTFFQVWLEKTGEYMVGAAGEVHLQRCLTDLEERWVMPMRNSFRKK